METLSVYRKLLRAIKTHITKDLARSPFKEYVALEFRKNAGLADKSMATKKLQLAQDYVTLLHSVHHHKDLLYSYNIAVDRTAEQKARLKNTAERVGLSLPELEYEDFEKTIN